VIRRRAITRALDHFLDSETVRDQQRLGATVAAGCEQFERAAAVGLEAVVAA